MLITYTLHNSFPSSIHHYLFYIFLSCIPAQPSQEIYFWEFPANNGDFIQIGGAIYADTYAVCPTDMCWRMSGIADAGISISTVGYHNIEISIDMAEENVDKNDFCWLAYSPDPSLAEIDSDCILTKGEGQLIDCLVTLPNNNDYNNNQVYIVLNGGGGQTDDYCFWDNLRVFGIPYTNDPTSNPTPAPTLNPTPAPTNIPTISPTNIPSLSPSKYPSNIPSYSPTTTQPTQLTQHPTYTPTSNPTADPTNDPTKDPTSDPTYDPTKDPTYDPTNDPTADPTNNPTFDPTYHPTNMPTMSPTPSPILEVNNVPTTTVTALNITNNFDTTNANNDNNQKVNSNNNSSGFGIGRIAFVCILIGTLCCIIGFLIFLTFKRRKNYKFAADPDVVNITVSKNDKKTQDFDRIGSMSHNTSDPYSKLPEIEPNGRYAIPEIEMMNDINGSDNINLNFPSSIASSIKTEGPKMTIEGDDDNSIDILDIDPDEVITPKAPQTTRSDSNTKDDINEMFLSDDEKNIIVSDMINEDFEIIGDDEHVTTKDYKENDSNNNKTTLLDSDCSEDSDNDVLNNYGTTTGGVNDNNTELHVADVGDINNEQNIDDSDNEILSGLETLQ